MLDSYEEELAFKYQKRDPPIQFLLRIKNDFNYDSGKARIFRIENIVGMPANLSDADKSVFFTGLFDFECKLTIQTVGGLLKYLDNKQINFDYASNTCVPIHTVSKINLEKLLMIDSNTFKSLDIFKTVDLTCALRQHDFKKSDSFRTYLNDKLSDTLYGLYSSKILTKIGLAKLRSFMLKPVRDIEILNERHTVVDFFVNFQNNDLTQSVKTALKKCKYINNILKKMRIAKCSLTEWKRFFKFVY